MRNEVGYKTENSIYIETDVFFAPFGSMLGNGAVLLFISVFDFFPYTQRHNLYQSKNM